MESGLHDTCARHRGGVFSDPILIPSWWPDLLREAGGLFTLHSLAVGVPGADWKGPQRLAQQGEGIQGRPEMPHEGRQHIADCRGVEHSADLPSTCTYDTSSSKEDLLGSAACALPAHR